MTISKIAIPVSKKLTIISERKTLPNFFKTPSYRKEIQITCIIQGSGNLFINNNLLTFKPNDVFVIGSYEPSIFKSDLNNKSTKVINLFFDPNSLLKLLLEFPECKSIGRLIKNDNFKLEHTYATYASKKIHEVNESINSYKLASFLQLLQILTDSENLEFINTDESEILSDIEEQRINAIYAFTMDQYYRKIVLEEVANVANLAPESFCRYFKKQTKETYGNFLRKIRVNEASKKLITGEYNNISSLAYDCGFTNATSFNRVFKKIKGMSPKQFIPSYKNHKKSLRKETPLSISWH